jgi:hypothetical protein
MQASLQQLKLQPEMIISAGTVPKINGLKPRFKGIRSNT